MQERKSGSHLSSALGAGDRETQHDIAKCVSVTFHVLGGNAQVIGNARSKYSVSCSVRFPQRARDSSSRNCESGVFDGQNGAMGG
jgi:hypothetical protein